MSRGRRAVARNGGRRPAAAVVRDPEESQRRLLQAAAQEFARKGLLGARVDVIAARAGVNKQLIYYHFGGKDALYMAVLEQAYADIRAREQALHLGDLEPVAAMRRLVVFTFDYLKHNPRFLALLADENVHRGRHLKQSTAMASLRSPLIALISEVLRRGAAAGVFRDDVDPVQFYISLAGLCYFYHGNVHTLSVLFEHDLLEAAALERRRRHVMDVVLGYLQSAPTQHCG